MRQAELITTAVAWIGSADERESRTVKTVVSVALSELADLMPLTSAIQDAKRAAIQGKPSRWPHRLKAEFAQLEARADGNPYVALDLEYLRDPSLANRSFAYVVTYDTFLSPPRDAFGAPAGQPELVSVVKLGDGGQSAGRGAGAASGSIISRTVRSYWEEPNTYRGVLQGVVIPGSDARVSANLAAKLGGRELCLRGDTWRSELLERLCGRGAARAHGEHGMSAMKGSKRHICWYVNDGRGVLNAALFSASRSLVEAAASDPEWVSPLADEGYEEYWNERFLERLELLDEHLESFREFWPFKPWANGKVSPRGTPHWDALARLPL